MRRKNDFGWKFVPASQKFPEMEVQHLYSQLFFNLKPSYTLGSLRNDDSLEKFYFPTPKNFPARHSINLQQCISFTDSAQIASDRMPTKVSHPYPQFLKIFDHPLNDEDLQKI